MTLNLFNQVKLEFIRLKEKLIGVSLEREINFLLKLIRVFYFININ